ncbi:MAG: hypothetical protein RSC43_01060 [Clostridia bacterium]
MSTATDRNKVWEILDINCYNDAEKLDVSNMYDLLERISQTMGPNVMTRLYEFWNIQPVEMLSVIESMIVDMTDDDED